MPFSYCCRHDSIPEFKTYRRLKHFRLRTVARLLLGDRGVQVVTLYLE